MSNQRATVSKNKSIRLFDPYVDWSHTVKYGENSEGSGLDLYLPVFLQGRIEEIEQTFSFKELVRGSDRTSPKFSTAAIFQDPHELFRLNDEDSNSSGYVYLPISIFIHEDENDSLREFIKKFVRDVGVPVALNDERQNPLSLEVDTSFQPEPIVAIIDDGIAYLNSRFVRKTPTDAGFDLETRFLALWQQAIEKPETENAPSYVRIGRVLTKTDIQNDVSCLSEKSEFEIYKQRNDEVYGKRTHRSTQQVFSHGTAVLDVAAGADLEDAGSAPDLLAVQLPPETLEDTSGTRLETFLLMGLSWLLYVAENMGKPIIINISLGVSAGNKNGGRFLETQLKKRIENHNKTNNHNAQVVFAYGNSYLERLTAKFELKTEGQLETVFWNIQPDDRTESYLHIHLQDLESTDLNQQLNVRLTDPNGDFFIINPEVETSHDLRLDGKIIGRAYQDLAEGSPRIIIGLAPTQQFDGSGILCASGSWRIDLENSSHSSVTAIIQVQRGDMATGFAQGGRQSYLDHPDSYGEDPITGDFNYAAPDTDGITRDGTNNALLVDPTENIHIIGSVMDVSVEGQTDSTFRPTRDTAASDIWSQKSIDPEMGPSSSAISQDGIHSPGVIASGTFSGSTVTVAGTSIAAARFTRHLAAMATAPDTAGTIVDVDNELNRTGGKVLKNEGGARKRHPESEIV